MHIGLKEICTIKRPGYKYIELRHLEQNDSTNEWKVINENKHNKRISSCNPSLENKSNIIAY